MSSFQEGQILMLTILLWRSNLTSPTSLSRPRYLQQLVGQSSTYIQGYQSDSKSKVKANTDGEVTSVGSRGLGVLQHTELCLTYILLTTVHRLYHVTGWEQLPVDVTFSTQLSNTQRDRYSKLLLNWRPAILQPGVQIRSKLCQRITKLDSLSECTVQKRLEMVKFVQSDANLVNCVANQTSRQTRDRWPPGMSNLAFKFGQIGPKWDKSGTI